MQKTMIFLVFSLCGMAAGQGKELPGRPPGEFFPLRAQDHQGAASFQKGQPVVGTTYFYWYDIQSKAHIIDHDGSDALTTHPADLEGISYKRPAWHERQLRDMMDAGIDFLMPVFWGVPGSYDGWSFVGLPPLLAAHTALEKKGLRPPAIGMFFDTSILAHNNSGRDGGRYHVDLSTDYGKQWFYAAIRDFFSLIPPAKWARIDGRPIIFLYDAAFVKKQDPAGQFAYVKNRFREDLGVEPFLVKSPGWQGEADAVYSWGGAVSGPLIFPDTVALGPGYDHSAVPGRQPLIVPRQDGRTYIERWTKVLQLDPQRRPWLVHVETWNEWHEGTDVADSREYRRSYIVLTRLFADMWRTRTQLHLPGSYADAESVSWEPGQAKGLDLAPSGGDGCWDLRRFVGESPGKVQVPDLTPGGDSISVPRSPAGVPAAVSTANPHSPTSRYLYFNVDDAFAFGLTGKITLLKVVYRDDGCGAFGIDYDSTVAEGPFDGAFRPAGDVTIGGTGGWKTTELRLPDCRFMNRSNGADFRLAVRGGELELAIRRVELRKID